MASTADAFLGALVFSQILSVGYRVGSMVFFFPDYTADGVRSDSVWGLAAFMFAGALALFVTWAVSFTADKSMLRMIPDALAWLMVVAWWTGNVAIGYSFTADPAIMATIHNASEPAVAAKWVVDTGIYFSMVCVGGGYFYMATLAQSLQEKSSTQKQPTKTSQPFTPSVLIDTAGVYVLALLVNICFTGILAPQGGYLYAFRITILVGTVLLVVRALTWTMPDKPGGQPSPNKASKLDMFLDVWHIALIGVASTVLFLPVVLLPYLVTYPLETLHMFFGGAAVGGILGGTFVMFPLSYFAKSAVTRLLYRIHDVCAVLSLMVYVVLFTQWPQLLVHAYVFGFFLGSAMAMFMSWALFIAMRQEREGPVVPRLLGASAAIGTGVACSILVVNMDWTTNAPIEALALAGSALGMAVAETMLRGVF